MTSAPGTRPNDLLTHSEAPSERRREIPVFTSPEGARVVEKAYRRVLERWPLEHRDREVATGHGVTHVIESGPADGPVVVLLHAYFATAMSWYRAVGALGSGYRTIAVDIVGDANPSRPTQPMATLDDYRDWYGELLDALGVGDHALVGNSFGGFLATTFAMAFPDRVTRLVLIGPAATFHGMPAFYTHMFIPKAAISSCRGFPGGSR